MKAERPDQGVPRHRFLRAAALAAGAAGGAAATIRSAPAEARVNKNRAASSGYRETEHVGACRAPTCF
jgi:hypothetical protein